jgi:hypothetical protein
MRAPAPALLSLSETARLKVRKADDQQRSLDASSRAQRLTQPAPCPTTRAVALDTPKGKGKSPARPVSGTGQTSRVAHWHDLEPTRLWNGDLFTVLPAELLDLCVLVASLKERVRRSPRMI